jgi:hypothetical protein
LKHAKLSNDAETTSLREGRGFLTLKQDIKMRGKLVKIAGKLVRMGRKLVKIGGKLVKMGRKLVKIGGKLVRMGRKLVKIGGKLGENQGINVIYRGNIGNIPPQKWPVSAPADK